MSVENTTAFTAELTANGTTTVFPWSFYAASADEIAVYRDGVVIMTGFTVSRAADGTGSVTFTTAPTSGTKIRIVSDPDFTQETEFQQFGPFRPNAINEPLDRAAARDIWLKAQVSSALRGPVGSTLAPLDDLTPGDFLYVKTDGNIGSAPGSGVDDGLRAELMTPGGAGIVFTKRDAANSISRSLEDKVNSEVVSVADWGVAPSNVYIPGTGAKINQALEEAPLGSTLCFHGLYYTEVPIVQRRGVNIHFEPGAGVVSVFDDDTKDVWQIVVEEMPFAAGEARQLRFDNFRLSGANGFAARDILLIENVSPLVGNLQCLFVNPTIIAQPEAVGHAVNIKGLVTQMHVFLAHFISGGVYLNGCADGCRFLYGQVDGIKPAFTVDLAGGAFKTQIVNNILTARDGALIVLGGSQIDFHYNQIEQVEARGDNQNAHSASVIISADSYGSRGVSIEGNNFGGAERVDYHIYAKSSSGKKVEDLMIKAGNTYSKAALKDIKIADAGVRYTDISPGQLLRGERGTEGYDTYPDVYGANTDDVNSLIEIEDSGTGTSGVRLGASRIGGSGTTSLDNGWTCSDGTYAHKVDGEVRFMGWATGPAAAQNEVVIATLPEGFRPPVDCPFPIAGYDLGTGAAVSGLVLVLTTGAVICTRPASTNSVRIGLGPIRFVAKRQGYDPSY